MSSSNTTDIFFKREENCLLNAPSVELNESRKLKLENQDMSNGIKHEFVYSSYEKGHHKEIYNYIGNGNQCFRPNFNKRYKHSLDDDTSTAEILKNIQQNQTGYKSYNVSNGSSMKSPIRKHSLCKDHPYQNSGIMSSNNIKLVNNQFHVADLATLSINRSQYPINGSRSNKIKTANSYGSTYLMQPHNITNSTPNHIFHQDTHELHNNAAYIHLANVQFPIKTCDTDVQKNAHNGTENKPLSIPGNYINSAPGSYVDLNSLCFRNNNGSLINHMAERKDSIPECVEPPIEGSLDYLTMKSPTDMYTSNISPYQNREESSNSVVTNVRSTSVPFINQTAPVFIYNNGITPDSLALNNGPPLCFSYNNDNIITNNFIQTEHPDKHVSNVNESEAFKLPQTEVTNEAYNYFSAAVPEPCNDPLPLKITQATQRDIDTLSSAIISLNNGVCHQQTGTSDNSDIEIKTVGKFTVSTSRDNEVQSTVSTGDLSPPPVQNDARVSNEVPNKNLNIGNQQPRSRFKKTRIRETVERWCTSGMSTYDCRFKVIPAKIMDLQSKNLDYMSENFERNLLQNFEDHDNGYRCHSDKYYNKEFFFWDNGERISICGKAEYDTENNCQFHAKFLKLLNQNQNLSLSQLAPQNNSVTSTIVPCHHGTIHEIFITAPEDHYHTFSIDAHQSQNDLFSAPPASPSLQTSFDQSGLVYNIYNPNSMTDIVVLRCHTPMIQSCSSRHPSSISVDKLQQMSSSRMSLESDNTGIFMQPVMVTDNNSMEEIHENRDCCSMPLPSLCCSSCPDTVDGPIFGATMSHDQQSLYSMGQMPQFICPLPQQGVMSQSPTMNRDHALKDKINLPSHPERTLSSIAMHEIDESLMSLKTVIQNVVMAEQEPLLKEIRSLQICNDNLRSELSQARHRSEYLESVLRAHNVPLDVMMMTTNDGDTGDGDCGDADSTRLSRDRDRQYRYYNDR